MQLLKEKGEKWSFWNGRVWASLRYIKTFSLEETAMRGEASTSPLSDERSEWPWCPEEWSRYPFTGIIPHMNTRYNERRLTGLTLRILCTQLQSSFHMNIDVTRTANSGIKLNRYPPAPHLPQVLALKAGVWCWNTSTFSQADAFLSY